MSIIPFVSANESCSPTGISASGGIVPNVQLWIFLILGLVLVGSSLFSKKVKKKKDWRKWYLIVGILLVLWAGSRFYQENLYTQVHLHANFKVIIDGKEVDFAKPEFMAESKEDHNKKVHLHDLNGGVVHVHYPDMEWQDLFETLEMRLDKDCLTIDQKEHCGLHFFVNDNEISSLGEIHDLDKILITSSKEPELASIPDDACIYSNKCPERGPAKGMESQGSSCSG